MATAYTDQVQKVYIAYYGRAADPVGLAYWAAKVETDGLAGIMASFGASAEATTLFGSLTNTAKVNALYQQSFGRDADFAGLMYYAGQLTAGTMTAATIAQNIFDGASGTDATILANKLIVAKAYTTAIDTAAEVVAYSGTVAAAAARALLTTVDAATVTASFDVATSVASIVSVSVATPAVAGSTIALTKTTDTLTGGAGADTFNGVIAAQGGDGSTALAGDSITGGDGIDTMVISATGLTTADYSAAAITTKGVEKLYLSNFDTNTTQADTHTVDASLMTGLTTVGLSASGANGDTDFTNLKNLVDAEMSNGSADLSVSYQATVVAGTTDNQNLTLSNQTAGLFTAANVETVAITSKTLANTLTTLTADSATKLTLSGDVKLTITDELSATVANIATIDASGMTAAVSLVNNNTTTTATLGSANDTYKTSAAVAATYSVDGGAGTDTLSVTAETVLDTAAETARYTNFEAMTINHSVAITNAYDQDMALLVGIDEVTVIADDSTDSTIDSVLTTNLTNARATTTLNVNGLTTAESSAMTVTTTVATATDSAADTLNLVLGTATASSGADVIAVANGKIMHNVTASDAETINVTSQGGANKLGTIDAADLTTLNVSGGKTLSMTAISNNTLTSVVDASGLTGTAALVMGTNGSTTAGTYTGSAGADTLTGGTKADTITGGAGIDTITGGAGGDTVHGGDGADIITSGSGADTINGDAGDDVIKFATANFTLLDTVSGGAGADTISFTDASTIADADFTNVTSVETIKQVTSGHALTVVLGALSNASGLTKVTDGTSIGTVTVGAGHTNALEVSLSTGNDIIDGSASSAPLTITVAADSIDGSDTWTGGTGADTLSITASGTAITAAELAAVTGIETFSLKTNATTGAITLSDNNIAEGKALTVDGTKITGSNKILTVDGTAELDGYLTVLGGAGADVITGTASSVGDNLKGNAGNDDFNFATANLTSADVVDGGAGTEDDLITSDGGTLVDTDFTGITNVEELSLFAGTTVTLEGKAQAAGFTTFTTSTGTNSVTLKAGYTSDFTLTLSTGVDSVIGTAYTGSMNIKVTDSSLIATDTVTGGTGSGDKLTITASGNALTAAELIAVTKVETFVVANDIAQSITLHDNNTASSGALTIDGTAMATAALTVVGTAETNGSVTVLGGGGADLLTGTASSSGDTLTGNGGGDTFTFAVANLTALDTISGGSGTDNITFTGTGTVSDADLAGVTSVETINTANAAATITLGANAAAAGVKTLNLPTGSNINIVTVNSLMTNSLTIAMSDNSDTISASAYTGALTLTLTDDELTADDTFSGGTGTDTLKITFGNTAIAAADMANVSKIEVIKSATNATAGLTLADANIASGKSMTINAVKNTSAAFTLDAALELDGTITFVGGAGVDTVTGGAKNDTIDGKAGADVITGGKGVDSLTGGNGVDKFTYTDANQSNSGGADTIVDFVTGTDKILITIDKSAKTTAQTFDATINTAAAGTTAVQNGLSGSIGQATYDTTNSQLVVNANADNLVTTLDYVINVGAVATAANSIVDADINFTLTGGTGADSITVGGGDDTIDFTSDAAADTFFFADANGSDSIINFDDDEDFLSFANITADGTIAELAVANDAGTTLATTTISSANTIVYVIDTDATELGTNIAAVISDFTSMSVVATFLNSADGVVTSDTANKTDFFIINDGSVATAAYVYVLEDNNDGITTVQAAELTLIGTITTDAAIDVGDTLIA